MEMNTVPILQGGCGAISTTAARVPCAAQNLVPNKSPGALVSREAARLLAAPWDRAHTGWLQSSPPHTGCCFGQIDSLFANL